LQYLIRPKLLSTIEERCTLFNYKRELTKRLKFVSAAIGIIFTSLHLMEALVSVICLKRCFFGKKNVEFESYLFFPVDFYIIFFFGEIIAIYFIAILLIIWRAIAIYMVLMQLMGGHSEQFSYLYLNVIFLANTRLIFRACQNHTKTTAANKKISHRHFSYYGYCHLFYLKPPIFLGLRIQ